MIWVMFAVPSAFRALSVHGEVVWAKRITDRSSYRMGVRFLNPSTEDISLLRSLEERHWAVSDERKRELDATVARDKIDEYLKEYERKRK